MLLTFLYHRVSEGKYANTPAMMQEHLRYLSKRHRIVLPGDPLPLSQLPICLTFDDAYFDFYHSIFPLLKELKIGAVLAVPVQYILNSTRESPEKRLSVSYKEAMQGDTYKEKVPFCTWEELKEMAASGYVKIGSHSFSHTDLTKPGIDLAKELIHSKEVLEEKLGIQVDTFIYPLGKFNKEVHSLAKKHYTHVMRIGSAWNVSWKNRNGLIYRIPSDSLKEKGEKLKPSAFISYLWSFLIHSLRGR